MALASLTLAVGRALGAIVGAAAHLPRGFLARAALGATFALAAFLGMDAFWSHVAASSYPTSDYIVESQEIVRRATVIVAAVIGFLAGFSLIQRR